MSDNQLQDSELILNKDGSVYHIHLRPEHVADTVIVVGDQGRVEEVSKYFDRVDHKISNREFITHVGSYKGKSITVISTGIGTDNIDIVATELDAAINVDLENRTFKENRRSLNLIRIGTSGALQPDIEVGSFVISEYGLGFEGLPYFYNYPFSDQETLLANKVNDHLNWDPRMARPYITEGSAKLINTLGEGMVKGITATASGFYGPQGRKLYLKPSIPDIGKRLRTFSYEGHRITNFEMETSALYSMGKMMGHQCATCCAIIANRFIKAYADDYKSIVNELIITVLDRIAEG